MIIAVDFDGTCVTHEFLRGGGFGNTIMTMYGDRLIENLR